jgi:hypothetical protein
MQPVAAVALIVIHDQEAQAVPAVLVVLVVLVLKVMMLDIMAEAEAVPE